MTVPSPYFIASNFNERHAALTPWPTVQPEPTFRDYLRIIRKRWRIILIPVAIALAITVVVLSVMTPLYTATTQILIERQTPQVLDIPQPGTETPEVSDDEMFYNTQYELLDSRSLAAQVILELGLQNNPLFTVDRLHDGFSEKVSASAVQARVDHIRAQHGTLGVDENAVDTYLKLLSVEPDRGTRLVTIGFTTADPKLSARIANAHVQAFITRGTDLRAQASESAERFLKRKLTELKGKVEQSEAALNDYRRERGIVGTTTDDKTHIILDRLTDLNKELTSAEAERITLDAQAELLRTRDYRSLPAVLNGPVIQGLKEEEAKVEEEYSGLVSDYKPDYPPLKDAASKLHHLQARLDKEMQRIAKSLELGHAAAMARENELRQEIDAEKKRALALNDAALQDGILAREVDTNRELYKSVLARMNEMGMAAGISASNVSIVDAAEPPKWPSSPKALLTLVLVGLVTLVGGVSCAFVRERLQDSFSDPSEVELLLGIPNLGLVPDFRKLKAGIYGSGRRLAKAVGPAQIEYKGKMGEIADGNSSFQAASEAYRAIRHGLLLSRAETPPKTVLITSATAKEGKTVTAINTAIAFAQMGSKVLLVDADLRRARCHRVLSIDNRAGLTEALAGQGPVNGFISATPVNRLWCLTAGTHPPNPGELLGSAKMVNTLDALKAEFDCIVIDSAPLLPLTDTLPLATAVDGVLLVVGPQTPKDVVRATCARLSQIRTKILGVILNQAETTKYSYYHYPASSLDS